MTTKHTPAPWSVSFYTGAIESGEKVVATVNYRISEGNPDNNAKLIAAAPDLLEALQLIFKHYDRNNGEAPHHCHAHKAHWDLDDSPCEVCSDWEKARAAINKATGEYDDN